MTARCRTNAGDERAFAAYQRKQARKADRQPAPERDPDALGPCGCTDYHMADCPTRDAHYDDAPEPDEDWN